MESRSRDIYFLLFVIVFLLIAINILASIYLFIEGVKRSEKIYTSLSENREIFRNETKAIGDFIKAKEIVICETK